ncbi:efflux transporter outer membrane subunit [Galbibacter orientalis]|uniref:Efflux transporter, outer membrane factor lipoprotein, NodT family n=1 Tax=Galbibacter orientalis DSM 19592 TaxID=926559 RepID=I3C352_9FLAO|nr:efflux transporter outer membrane subunit [Galbibacter orientalis]EIJ38045.1 efflux transporter, outer membrane factor lipoprotein, NodT family [Galbibacter orientalis DSM 19592]
MKNLKIYKIILGLSAPLLLQSCFVAKNYERPEVETENLYRTDQLSQDSTSLGMVSWRTLFKDPILERYIDTALVNNLDIRMALQQIVASEAYLKQGKAGNYPTLNLNGTVTRQENSENSQFGSIFNAPYEQYDLTASLSWEADIWGKIRSNKRAFEATYLQTIEAHKAVKTELIAALASTYYQLLSLDEQLKITNETVENREGSLETTKALKDAGMVTEVAVKQTEAQLYTAKAIKIDLENQIKLLENAFSILLAQPPHAIERSVLESQEIDQELTTGVPYLMLQNRPDVASAEYGLINAFELTNVARSSFYPSITLSASAGFQSLNFDDWIDASSIFNSLVGGLAQPILNGRKIRTQFEVSKAQQESALLNYKQTLLTAGREVSDALYSYQAAVDKIEARQKEYEAYSLATEYSEELLNQGLVNYLEVLTARENSLNSELLLVENKYLRLNAVVTLYQALGGGWQ